jgi:hypothetical protein
LPCFLDPDRKNVQCWGRIGVSSRRKVLGWMAENQMKTHPYCTWATPEQTSLIGVVGHF